MSVNSLFNLCIAHTQNYLLPFLPRCWVTTPETTSTPKTSSKKSNPSPACPRKITFLTCRKKRPCPTSPERWAVASSTSKVCISISCVIFYSARHGGFSSKAGLHMSALPFIPSYLCSLKAQEREVTISRWRCPRWASALTTPAKRYIDTFIWCFEPTTNSTVFIWLST